MTRLVSSAIISNMFNDLLTTNWVYHMGQLNQETLCIQTNIFKLFDYVSSGECVIKEM